MTRILQEVMFMRCFTTGNLLVVFGWCQTSLQRLWSSGNTQGHMKLSLLPSELRLGAELSSHCLLGHCSGITDMRSRALVPPLLADSLHPVFQPRLGLFGYSHTSHLTSQSQGTELVCRGKPKAGHRLYWDRSFLTS